ncbi:hypothetical protein JWR97_11130, partial [Pseudomonas cedrina subsp. fulgida]|nr:hypothetical protein [Pseudomonas cedrina subsp. fulgida]
VEPWRGCEGAGMAGIFCALTLLAFAASLELDSSHIDLLCLNVCVNAPACHRKVRLHLNIMIQPALYLTKRFSFEGR